MSALTTDGNVTLAIVSSKKCRGAGEGVMPMQEEKFTNKQVAADHLTMIK